jgi:siroheme synthase-like protein
MAYPVLPVALRLAQRPVLLIGGDDEAVDKLPKLQQAGALITVVAQCVDERISDAARRRELVWYARAWGETDLLGQTAVVLASRDATEAQRLFALRTRHRFWLCAVDQPAFCDFFLMSTVRRGPVQIGITTGGAAPLLARRIRQALEHGMPEEFAEFCHEFAQLRESVATLNKAERVATLESALNGFAMDVALRYPEPVGASARAEPGAGRGP